MKKKNRKLNGFIGLFLCLVMLIGLVPVQNAVALEDPFKTVKYEKVTSVDELIKGNNYVITYKDQTDGNKYALSTDGSSYSALVELKNEDTLLVDPDGSYVFELTKKNTDSAPFKYKFEANGVGLKVNDSDGVFAASAADLYLNCVDGYWSIASGTRALSFSNGSFTVVKETEAIFEIWTPAPSSSTYIKLASIDQLADFKDDTEFVIVLETEDGLKAIGYGSNWCYDVDTITDVDGTEYISVDDRYPVVFDYHGAFTTGTVNKITYCGFDNNGIRLKNGYYFYPQNASNTYSPFRNKGSENNTVHFEYGTGSTKGNYSDKIYIRGNGNSTYLGINEEGNYSGKLAQNSEGRLPVQIYVALPDDAVRVEYLDAEGNLSKVAYTEKDGKITLINNVADVKHNGLDYAFVGWTMTKPEDPFLSLDDSCNIFDYDNETESAHILDTVAAKYGLIGDCNADYSSAVINMQEVDLEDGEPLQLYPIYAVRGFDTVVTALEADNTKIIGISDWKADPAQGLESYFDGGIHEKWLGYIDVQMFKDGVEWVAPTRLYYRYHNDNTADLTIKFISDYLLKQPEYQNYADEIDPLYLYMSDQNQYPEFDQTGHFVLDAVYAYQGGSEDGLKYSLNWMTDHGGQLDNVEGGSLVQLFVSTKYNVKYYLDDEEIADNDWFNSDYYTTPGTSDLFNYIAADADYKVRFDNNLVGLMDRDFTKDEDPEKDADIVYEKVQATDPETGLPMFDDEGQPIYEDRIVYNPHEWFLAHGENGERGEPEYYSYLMHEYEHVIPLAISPAILVKSPLNRANNERKLISKMWSLKDKNFKVQTAHDWESYYSIFGTVHGTGNTSSSYTDRQAIDIPYTFHLYAYTAVPGDVVVTNTVKGPGADKDKEFHYTFTLESTDDFDAEDVNGWYGDIYFEKGVGEFVLKDGEDVSIEDLPAGLTFTVVEKEFNEDGYESSVNIEKGTVPENDVIQSDFINEKPVELATGDIVITNKVTGEGADMDKVFHYVITLDDETINGTYGDLEFVNGVAEFSLKDGESVTAKGLPAGISYTVVEIEYNEDGYTSSVVRDAGTIPANGVVQVDFVNDKPIEPTTEEPTTEEPTTEEPTTEEPTTEEPTTEEPTTEEPTTQPEKPAEAPNTGDENQLGMWMMLMVTSLLGMAVFFVYYKKRTKNA